MSNFQTLDPVTGGIPGTAPSIWSAVSSDSLGTILTEGYLDDLGDKVKTNDIFYINYLDTSSQPLNGANVVSISGVFRAQYGSSHMSLIQLPDAVGSEQFVQVALTAAQWNGMYTTPVQLLAAPGANKLILVERMALVMTFVSADYAAGGIVAAQYDSTAHGAGVLATNSEAAADFFAAASTTFYFTGVSGNTVGALPFSTTVNKGLYLSNASGAFTTGDSTWIAKVWYRLMSSNS